MSLTLKNLRCCHESAPVAVTGTPIFSWQLASSEKDVRQTAFELRIARGGETVYQTERRDSARSTSSATVL